MEGWMKERMNGVWCQDIVRIYSGMGTTLANEINFAGR